MPVRTSTRFASLVLGPLAVVALAAGCGGEGGSGYDGDFEAGFLRTCEAATGDDAALCQCTYDRLESSVPFERAERLDRRLSEDPESPLPDDVADLIAGCVAGVVPPSIATTTTSTTAPAAGETTTTAPGGTTTTAAEAG
ncbi:hypothetical protein B7486_58695 [cyanobacterium TDX16]|nr:hypothetical protein B7486_58695 [cyanobacterium TDX16]